MRFFQVANVQNEVVQAGRGDRTGCWLTCRHLFLQFVWTDTDVECADRQGRLHHELDFSQFAGLMGAVLLGLAHLRMAAYPGIARFLRQHAPQLGGKGTNNMPTRNILVDFIRTLLAGLFLTTVGTLATANAQYSAPIQPWGLPPLP